METELRIDAMLRKFGVILLYTLCWLSYYQVVDIVREPSKENMIKILWAVFAGILLAYVMGFDTKLKKEKKGVVVSVPPQKEED